jgi:hypothetical protein
MEGGVLQDLRQGLGPDEVGVIMGPTLDGLEAKIKNHNVTRFKELAYRKIFDTVFEPEISKLLIDPNFEPEISKLLIDPKKKGFFEFFLRNGTIYVLLYTIYDKYEDTKIVEQYCVLSILKEKPKNSEEKFKVYKIHSIQDLSKLTTFKQNLENMMSYKVGKKQRIYHIYCVKMVGGDAEAELASTGAGEDVTRNTSGESGESGYASIDAGLYEPVADPVGRTTGSGADDQDQMYEVVDAAPGAPAPPPPRSGSVPSGSIVYSSAPAAGDEPGARSPTAAAAVPEGMYTVVKKGAAEKAAAARRAAEFARRAAEFASTTEIARVAAQRAATQRAEKILANATFNTSKKKNSAAPMTDEAIAAALVVAKSFNRDSAIAALTSVGQNPGDYCLRIGRNNNLVVTVVNEHKKSISYRITNDSGVFHINDTANTNLLKFNSDVEAVKYLQSDEGFEETGIFKLTNMRCGGT